MGGAGGHTIVRPIVHIALHLFAPLAVAWLGWREQWVRAWLIMLATMAVDLDHLLADPLFDPNRCSIGFHPLHTMPAVALYALACLHPRTRLVGLGLIIHMVLDGIDCVWMAYAP